jgi:hypothetical protein
VFYGGIELIQLIRSPPSGGFSVVPLVTYENADLQKMCLIKDSGGKTGVYR